MIFQLRWLLRFCFPIFLGLALFTAGIGSGPLRAAEVVLLMKSGDLVSGQVVAENTNQMVISNAWAKALSIPLAEIARRQTLGAAKVSTPAPAVVAKPAPAPAPAPPAKLAASAPSVAKPAAPKGKWHGQINVGMDVLFNTQNRQDYFASSKLTYERAYASNPKKFFRNTTQANGEYQKTDNAVSANRAFISNKSDFDIGVNSYGYVSGGTGFDQVSKIDSQYQAGGGAGRHMIRTDRFVLDLESGLDYEVQNRWNTSDLRSTYGRLAEDLTWKMRKNLTLTQNLQYYSNLNRTSQYHGNFTANLSYGFWENLSLNLTANEGYTTEVAPGVERNTFEVRLTLGVTF